MRWVLCFVGFALPVWAAPTGGTLVEGSATIDDSGGPTLTTITQTSARALLDWTTFDIDPGETVNFIQPGATSIAINRVSGGGASLLAGALTANGQVWLLNPNGIALGGGASVNVAGVLMAPATLDNAADFVNEVTDVATLSGGTGGLTIDGAVTATNQAYGAAAAMTFDPTGNGLLVVTTPGALAVDVGGNLVASGGTLTIKGGDVTLGDGVALDGDTAVTVAASGNLTVDDQTATLALPTTGAVILTADSDSSGAGALTMVAGDTLTTQGALTTSGHTSALAHVTSVGAQTHSASGGITTRGTLEVTGAGADLTLNHAVTQGAATTLRTNDGDINVASTVNGAYALTMDAGAGNVVMGSTIGNATGPTTLTATAAALTLRGVNTTAAQQITGDVTTYGNLLASSGSSAVNGDVTLAGAASVGGGTGTYTVNGTVDGAYALTLTGGTGSVVMVDVLGGTVPLASLTATGAVSLKNVTTSGALSSAGATTLGGDLDAGTTLTLGGGATLTAARSLTSGGNMSVTGAVAGSYALTLDAGTADVTLNVPSAYEIVLAGGDDVFLYGPLTLTAGLDLTAMDDVVLQNDVVLTSGGNVTMDVGNALSGAHTLALTAGAVQLGPVSGLTGLSVDATSLEFLGDVVTSGAQTYAAPVTLGVATTLDAGTGAIDLQDVVDGAYALTLDGGAVRMRGVVGGSAPLASLSATGNSVQLDAAVETTGDVDVEATGAVATDVLRGAALRVQGSAVTLGGATTGTGDVTVLGSASVTNNAAIDSGGDVVITAPTLTLNDTVEAVGTVDLTASSGMDVLADVTGGGAVTLTGAASVHAAVGSATGDVTVGGPVALAGDSRVFSGGGVGDDVTLGGDVSGNYDLELDAGLGDVLLTGDVDIGSLSFGGADNLVYGGGEIRVRQALLFGSVGEIHLGGDTTLRALDGSTRRPVTAAAGNVILADVSGVDLTVFGGVVTLYQIGDTGSGKLNTLTVDATIANMLGSVYTLGDQTITASEGLAGLLDSGGGDITLNTTATLVDDVTIRSGGGSVTLNEEIVGPHTLTIDAGGGTVWVNAALGTADDPLADVTIDAGLVMMMAPMVTSGGQTFDAPLSLATTLTAARLVLNEAVTLTGTAMLDAPSIEVNGTVNGAYRLVLDSEDAVFTAAVGATTPLDEVVGVGSVNTQDMFVGTFDYTGTGTLVFNAGGLHTAGSLVIGDVHAMPTRIGGSLTSRGDMNLRALTIEAQVDAPRLMVGARASRLGGRVAGQTGRLAARLVAFSTLQGGPQIFGSYAIPMSEDYRLPQSFGGTMAARVGAADMMEEDDLLALPAI